METVTVSSDYRVVIPQRVRERMHLQPGKKLQVLVFDDRIELIPIRPMKEMRGFMKGFDPEFSREKEDRV
ncbi:MAG: AbrB/MazE/SpoVT family DNA-binding domain-containing protein [bacterium]|nr:AbrB/MazE/SpoVT family DNA-binding domain-containing protein [bacterium]